MRRARGAFFAVLAIATIVTPPANAAQLTLAGGQYPYVSSFVSCDTAVDASTPSTQTTSSSVQVAKISAACAGRALSVMVYNPTTGAIRTTSTTSVPVPAGGGALTVPTAAYTPSMTDHAFVSIDSWPVTATWTYTPAIWCTVISGGSPGATCAATVTVASELKTGGASYATYYDVVVTSTSTIALRWEVDFNLTDPVYGGVPTRLGNSTLDGFSDGATQWGTQPANDVTTLGACSGGQLKVRGTADGENVGGGRNQTYNDFRDVTSTRKRQFSLVADAPLAGFNDVLAAGCP
jgi:hypothetical protein